MARVIWWNVPGLSQQKAHRLLKKITEHADILTRNENGEAVIYWNAIPGSYFKSVFISMVSNQKNLTKLGLTNYFAHYEALVSRKMI